MQKQNFWKYCAVAVLFLILAAGLFGTLPQQTMKMNFQKLVIYYSRSTNEYYLAAFSTDESTRPGKLDTMNVHVILETNDGQKTTIDNGDLKISCLGNMYNKVIGEKNTLFRFNLVIDNSGSIDKDSFKYVQNSLKRFIELIPLVFEAQVIHFAQKVQVVPGFTKDKQELIAVIDKPMLRGNTALFDAVDDGINQLISGGDEVPLRFSVVLTDGKDTASKKNPKPKVFKEKIVQLCRQNNIALFIIGITDNVDSKLMKEMTMYGFYQHIKDFPDIDTAFDSILNVIKDTYIIKIPAVEDFARLKKIYLVKQTPGGNQETIQDFIVH
jgi:hypothetical protein